MLFTLVVFATTKEGTVKHVLLTVKGKLKYNL